MHPTPAGAPHAGRPAPTPARLGAKGDHRVRVAGQKRERMRERLIDATMAACLGCEAGRHPVVEDVIQIAEVSRGSFYKHFDAIDEVFAVIGRRMAHDMLSSYSQLVAALPDDASRVALGPLMALVRAAMEPSHAAFIARVDFVDYLASNEPRAHVVGLSLRHGRECGALHFQSPDAAMDLLIGACLEGTRRILRTRRLDFVAIRELTAMVLRGLGVTPADADRAVALAWQRLQGEAGTLHWWKPMDTA